MLHFSNFHFEKQYYCFCCVSQGFSGKLCESRDDQFNECQSNPCVNGGSCVDGQSQFRCICPAMFYGPRCQLFLPDSSTAPTSSQVCSTECRAKAGNGRCDVSIYFAFYSTYIDHLYVHYWIFVTNKFTSRMLLQTPTEGFSFVGSHLSVLKWMFILFLFVSVMKGRNKIQKYEFPVTWIAIWMEEFSYCL